MLVIDIIDRWRNMDNLRKEKQLGAQYNKLYDALLDLVATLNVLEPGGTLLDDIVFTAKQGGKVSVAYIATPIQLTINTPERTFILKVIENNCSDRPVKISRSRIEKEHKELLL